MVFKALEFIRKNLNGYLQAENPVDGLSDPGEMAVLGEVGLIENSSVSNEIKNKVILTLAYTEEESALRNGPVYVENASSLKKRNPPVPLNLGVVFSCNFSEYETALNRLSQVIAFFQSRSILTFSQHPISPDSRLTLSADEQNDLELHMEMMKLSLEEMNHLWGVLKYRVIPFVMYKIRLVEIDAPSRMSGSGSIEEIEVNIN